MTWNVAGVQGGNSTTGTISAAGLYTAPAAVPATNPVSITAVNPEDTAKSGSAMVTVTAAAAAGITVNSVSNSSPVPLTQIQVGTSGINSANAVTVTYSDGSGFSATEQAVRVQSDGTVIAGVPLFIDSATGEIGSGTVSMVLSQGTLSSAPTSIAILDLPPVSAYGAQPGQISHAFLLFEAMLHSRRLNEFQAAQQILGAKVDTTGAQSTMSNLIGGSLAARSDVDNVMSNSATVLSWGTLPSGRAVQFDAKQLDVMDRILAVYLSEQFALPGSSAALTQKLHGRPGLIAGMPVRPAVSFSSMTTLLGCLASNKLPASRRRRKPCRVRLNQPTLPPRPWKGCSPLSNCRGQGRKLGLPGWPWGTHIFPRPWIP